jgi:hypothetical protein
MKILVVSHDAGGAEVVSAWVKKNNFHQYAYYLLGPAQSVFSRKLTGIKILDCNDLELSRFDLVLTGTSWSSELERRMILQAKENGVKSAACLDHWTNYRERFGYPAENWLEHLPDEIWCGDEYAMRISSDCGIPAQKLRFVENQYFVQIKEEAEAYSHEVIPESILYVCEPVSEHMEKEHGDEFYLGYNEFTAMEFFLKTLLKSDKHSNPITIRLHPSEKEKKYDRIITIFGKDLQIGISKNAHLYEDIQHAETVVGCESMALVVALLLNKKVFTVIPPKGVPCRLPHAEIQSFYQHF